MACGPARGSRILQESKHLIGARVIYHMKRSSKDCGRMVHGRVLWCAKVCKNFLGIDANDLGSSNMDSMDTLHGVCLILKFDAVVPL